MDINKLQLEISKITEDIKNNLGDFINNHKEIIIIGNGGSNSIASHISQDYTKVLDKKSYSFSDPSRLTCYINDYGSDNAYAEFLDDFVEKDTLVILISSSGNSMNIINAAKYCEYNDITYLALTGFNKNNKLNNMNSSFKYYVDSDDYGIVECTHQILLHSII
jgi:D-sedoheptulose 7-phosphate isomerase|tara:strand:+ start:5387 stop:5878 length:492 start_codon:yes stop_codon:yes gene_type:complete